MRRFAPALLALWLAGCASIPPGVAPARSALRSFELEGRFALRATPYGEAPQSAAGRMTWTHEGPRDLILLSTPLGQAVAEIEILPGISRLLRGGVVAAESNDPESLVERATGHRLPVGHLAGWLLGESASAVRLDRDALGRPRQLADQGWLIDYFYETDAADEAPARLTLVRGDIELRLRIESWKELP